MSMENIIKKAIEGGYVLNKDEIKFALTTRMVCDPLFWQALGKACGWSDDGVTSVWLYHAHEFYGLNLTESWESAIKYLEELIK